MYLYHYHLTINHRSSPPIHRCPPPPNHHNKVVLLTTTKLTSIHQNHVCQMNTTHYQNPTNFSGDLVSQHSGHHQAPSHHINHTVRHLKQAPPTTSLHHY
ncbi:hypothetical protein RND81_10G028600 [Saponaria officinalis]|uniref:Uncharacterized protein n=1 Tax=Saponaria officinalis TaxID=3572 RepID=A0AAW1I058_SAPOF